MWKRVLVVVYRNGRPALEISPFGDISEIPPRPLRVKVIEQVVEKGIRGEQGALDFLRKLKKGQ